MANKASAASRNPRYFHVVDAFRPIHWKKLVALLVGARLAEGNCARHRRQHDQEDQWNGDQNGQ